MIPNLLCLLLNMFLSGQTEPPSIEELVAPYTNDCLLIDTIQQPYFEDVTFLRLDTNCALSVHYPAGYKPLRVAVDWDGRLYKLYNLDSMQFDQLIQRNPQCGVVLDVHTVYDYGRFFIELITYYQLCKAYYLSGKDEFLELSKRLLSEDEFARSVRKKLSDYEQQSASIPDDANYNAIMFDRTTRSYIVNYLIWYECNGNLRHVCLNIEWDGLCEVVTDTILARQVGDYDPYIE